MSSPAAIVRFEDVTKTYRDGTVANDGISFEVREGEVFGLLGPNGAGKTTLVNQLLGLTIPTSGQVSVGAVDVIKDPAGARRHCSVQPQTQVPIEGLTPREFIEFVGRLRGAPRAVARERTRSLLAAVDIEAWADRPSSTLSGGVLRLAAFCAAAVTPMAAVILDEPTNDVDPLRRRMLWEQVRTLADHGSAVLLVTHNVIEAERALDRVALLEQGRILACGTPAELKGHVAGSLRLELRFSDTPPTLPVFARAIASASTHMLCEIPAARAAEATAWASALTDQGHLEEFSLGPATLEDAYADHLNLDKRMDSDAPVAP